MVSKLRIEIEPIPQGNWGVSLANLLPPLKWDKVRKEVYKEYDYTCCICEGDSIELNAHEVWKFNDAKLIQKLVKIVCVCKLCHDCIHYGRSSQVYSKKYLLVIRKHIKELNNWTESDLGVYLEKIKRLSQKRVGKLYRVIVGKKELFIT